MSLVSRIKWTIWHINQYRKVEGYEKDYGIIGRLKCRLGFHLLNPEICVRCGWIVPHARPIYSEGHENLENMLEKRS